MKYESSTGLPSPPLHLLLFILFLLLSTEIKCENSTGLPSPPTPPPTEMKYENSTGLPSPPPLSSHPPISFPSPHPFLLLPFLLTPSFFSSPLPPPPPP